MKLKNFIIIFFINSFCFGNKIEDNLFKFLYKMMDKYHNYFYVYDDGSSGGNHFIPSGWMGCINCVGFDAHWRLNCQSGSSCIKINYKPISENWAGIYWQYPENNWGKEKGYNLAGATEISFWARGEEGGEKGEFKAGGIGVFDFIQKSNRDSFGPLETGVITLTREWKEYKISLKGENLKNVIGGFCWVTNYFQNPKGCTIYLDNIKFNLKSPNNLRFILSFKTTAEKKDIYLKNVAFTYDNALALIAFLSRGNEEDIKRAKIIADSFLYAQENDRFFKDGRLRNAYQSGDLIDLKTKKAKLPGWWDEKKKMWFEDKEFVGTHTGNIAWAMISLISFYEFTKEEKYLKSVEKLGEWVLMNCKDERGSGGYTGGYIGWEPKQEKLLWKSTEHNLDLYVAFERLYKNTKNDKWKEASGYAKKFLESVHNKEEGFFWTGTKEDGISINKDVIPLDVQVWGLLALREKERFTKNIRKAEKNFYVYSCPICKVDGFDFNDDKDGVWYEGTAQMAVGYNFLGEEENYKKTLYMLQKGIKRDGLYASCHNGISTGFNWKYYKRLHIGAASWAIFAYLKVNPYWEILNEKKM